MTRTHGTTRSTRTLSRRLFLAQLGRTTTAVAVLGTVGTACSASNNTGSDAAPDNAEAEANSGGLTWKRVNYGFVSAYVLVRGAEVAIVDTGTGGTSQIESTLADLSLGWDNVDHVIVTHAHGDHIGGLEAVMTAAANATAYAGAGDIDKMTAPRDIVAVADGEEVFGLQVLATPGHTPGHISVLDPDSGLLVAGDALIATGDQLQGPSPQYTDDLEVALDSVRSLADDPVSTILVGHGDPVTDGGVQLADLIAGL